MNLSTIKILLVEDDTHVCETIQLMLREMNIVNVHTEHNGRDALQYMDNPENGVDLIICDWNMPHKTGLEFLRETRQAYPDIPFLMVTARADEESVITAKQSGITAYIPKPVKFEPLRDKIMAILTKLSK